MPLHRLAFKVASGRQGLLLKRHDRKHPQQALATSMSHNMWSSAFALNLIHEGHGVYIDENGREYPLVAGTAFFRFPDRPHTTRIAAAPYDETWLTMNHQAYLHLRGLGVLNALQPVTTFASSAILEHLDGIAALAPLPVVHDLAGWTTCLQHIFSIFGLLQHDAPEVHAIPDWIPQARDILSSQLGRGMDIAWVAARIGVSEQHFRKTFKKHVGIPPMEYRIRMRVEQARSELMLASIAQVARNLGFGDPKHFSRQFRRYTGMAPRQFLVQAREALQNQSSVAGLTASQMRVPTRSDRSEIRRP